MDCFSQLSTVRSSRPEVFCYKDVLKNFTKFTGNYSCQSLFFNKVADLRPATLLKRDPGTGVFLWILQNLLEHLFYRTLQVGASAQSLQAVFPQYFVSVSVSWLRVQLFFLVSIYTFLTHIGFTRGAIINPLLPIFPEMCFYVILLVFLEDVNVNIGHKCVNPESRS